MTTTIYDIGIIGAGVAGSLAAYKISKEYRKSKTIVFDWGRPPMKRRRQLEGFLGCLPNSDGKFYSNNLNNLNNVLNMKTTNKNLKQFNNILAEIDDFKIVKDSLPSKQTLESFKDNGYTYELNDYFQMYPKQIHILSKTMAEEFEKNKNMNFVFDEDVKDITKHKNYFTVSLENTEYKCKKLILATGRSGWRWATQIYKKFGIITDNNVAKFGVKVQIDKDFMKAYNGTNLSLKKDNIDIGPICNGGKIIQEDLSDLAISSYRSNEPRYHTNYVSFDLMGNVEIKGKGTEEAERLCTLIYIISEDRADKKEKISTILNKKSSLSIFKEYNFLGPALEDLDKVMPNLILKGKVVFPTLKPVPPLVNVGSDLQTEIEGLYIVGDNLGFSGLLSAAVSGIAAADFVMK